MISSSISACVTRYSLKGWRKEDLIQKLLYMGTSKEMLCSNDDEYYYDLGVIPIGSILNGLRDGPTRAQFEEATIFEIPSVHMRGQEAWNQA